MFYQVTICGEDLVHEALDGEVVIVNLKNGRYYSLINSASAIWECLQTVENTAVLEREMRSRFRHPHGEMGEALGRFLAELADEGLIRLSPVEAEALTASEPDESAPEFETPTLNKHVDMEGMLLLDPVHDVSEAGWPEQKVAEP